MTSEPSRLLLIAGSRSLGASWRACLWARDHLTVLCLGARSMPATLAGGPGPARHVLLTGGAVGPDVWAAEIGWRLGWTPVVYRPDGRVEGGQRPTWGTPPAGRSAPPARNEAMVAHAARLAADGWRVGVVGLVDTASRTRGTDHCLAAAARAGLPVWRHEWRET